MSSKPDEGASLVPASLDLTGLIGYWPMDGSAEAQLGPTELGGVMVGDARFVGSPFGQALSCDGQTGFVEVSRSPALDVADGDFTIAAWIRPKELRQSGIICLGGYGYTHGWLIDMPDDSGRLRIETATPQNEPNGTVQTDQHMLHANRWVHFAVVVKRGSRATRLFINGHEVAQGSTLWSNLDNPKTKLYFGRIQDAHRFAGEIDEVWMFRRPLGADEIGLLVAPGSQLTTEPATTPIPPAEEPATRRLGTDSTAPTRTSWDPDGKFVLHGDEVVVFTGQTDMFRAGKDGTLEYRLTRQFSAARPRFRNMAWEGDTVYEQWRDLNFGSWNDQLRSVGASVIVARFGQVEALDGAGKLDEFIKAYESLLDQFAGQTQRILLLSPHRFEQPTSSLMPDLRSLNHVVERYTQAIRELAERRGYLFVDLYSPELPRDHLTENGMHLREVAHEAMAQLICRSLGLPQPLPASGTAGDLLAAIRDKNRLWFDNWRPMNWSFAFGDRTQQQFGQPSGRQPALRVELEEFPPLLATAEARIFALAEGHSAAELLETPGVDSTSSESLDHAVPDVDHSPQAELASFQVADEYQVNLFASEADGIVKPLQMRWDDSGRLWVLCAPTYPHINPGAKPGDYVMVCEDTDGDGKADKFTRFAEGLFIPMGIEFGDGGVFLCEATELVHLRDTNADGRADQRQVILSGFGTADSHQMISSLCWGPAGELFFTQGHHAYSHVETPWGVSRLHKSGVWRYRPRTGRLDGFFNLSSAGLNCQGVTFDQWGQIFHNSAAWSGGFYTVPGMIRTPRDVPYMAMAVPDRRNTGIEFVYTQHMPEQLQGSIVWSGFMSNAIQVHRLVDDESGYRAEVLPDLLTSSRQEFRPVCARVGPDGGIYVCDWYNPIIGHYQASYRDQRRDRTRGRIWRITAKNRPLVEHPKLDNSTPGDLLVHLDSPEGLVRYNARRRLLDAPADQVIPAVHTWLEQLNSSDERFPGRLVRGLGVLQAHGAVTTGLLERQLDAEDPQVRAFAVRAVGDWADAHQPGLSANNTDAALSAYERALEWLARAARDPHPRVRLAAIVACSYVPLPKSIEVASMVIDQPRDRYIDYALYQCVDALKPHWYPAMTRSQLQFGGHMDRLEAVVRLDGTADVAELVRQMCTAEKLDEQQRERLLGLLVSVGSPEDMRFAMQQSAAPQVLNQLLEVAVVHGRHPSGELASYVLALLEQETPEVRIQGMRLASAWKLEQLSELVWHVATGDGATAAELGTGLAALPELRGPDAVPILTRFADAQQPLEIQAAAISALAALDIKLAAEQVIPLLKSSADELSMRQILMPLLTHQYGASELANQLKDVSLARDTAILVHRVLSAAGREEAALTAVLNTAIGVHSKPREYDADFVRALANEIEQNGNAIAGREVYKSKLANCAACHKLAAQGSDLGPDLSNVGAGRSVELLLESVLWPNRQIREGYMSVQVLTDEGRIHTGYKLRETRSELHLREATSGGTMRIARDSIEHVRDAGSIMPSNLADAMTREELRDLIRFLSELGRVIQPAPSTN